MLKEKPVGMTRPTMSFETPMFTSLPMVRGIIASAEVAPKTTRSSSRRYLANLNMLKPAMPAMIPSTTTTNIIQVKYTDTISWLSCTECEVPWPEDVGATKPLHLRTRSTPMSKTPVSPLRARMIEDMNVRKFGEKTQNDYIRHVKTYAQ